MTHVFDVCVIHIGPNVKVSIAVQKTFVFSQVLGLIRLGVVIPSTGSLGVYQKHKYDDNVTPVLTCTGHDHGISNRAQTY